VRSSVYPRILFSSLPHPSHANAVSRENPSERWTARQYGQIALAPSPLEFHFCQRALKIWRWHDADERIAFVASYFRLISARQAE
jgi:hypothetical protein